MSMRSIGYSRGEASGQLAQVSSGMLSVGFIYCIADFSRPVVSPPQAPSVEIKKLPTLTIQEAPLPREVPAIKEKERKEPTKAKKSLKERFLKKRKR
jgi:hypothetical protein